ncbi:phosphoribosylanthranilate isomerase [Paeniglutamicibacter cryotolerans]|uniref:N-(5'-phosphoribosyl)anthranilate isomerase n=1 Tax=Paeniglutamicibacter cryotolerans TaxID=670079 RepID=A0A839QFB0_9MICC|nr:phosphoribosylanthranilate isomerase [Paeniglutamicibacter cryotolerans]MBB2994303.1 phosphoribosylanthranilate isomerase [Paeniglutamicibacter cryotolerans]
MPQLYIKICGLSTAETVAAAVAAGADAIGFVFAPGSPRTVAPDLVATLLAGIPEHVETVGVFRDQPLAGVLETARRSGVSTVQLHGDEPLGDITAAQAAGFRTLRAFSAGAYARLDDAARALWDNERILLDAIEPGAGVAFDPADVLAAPPAGQWLLAGGLNPDNVAHLAMVLRPDGVDVSSGVESRRGVKDPELVKAFIAAARSVR